MSKLQVGQTVVVKVGRGVFEGLLSSVDATHGVVTLSNGRHIRRRVGLIQLASEAGEKAN